MKEMAFNPFRSMTEAQLLAAREKILEELLSGSQLQSSSAGDVSMSNIIQEGPYARLAKVNKALHLLDPDAYPLEDVPVTRAVAVVGNF